MNEKCANVELTEIIIDTEMLHVELGDDDDDNDDDDDDDTNSDEDDPSVDDQDEGNKVPIISTQTGRVIKVEVRMDL